MVIKGKVTKYYFLHSEATSVTAIEVDVEELCTKTVTNIPIIKPPTGLRTISLSDII